jgi:hypothetical protein
MTPPRKRTAKKTTTRARAKETVAEEAPVEPTDEAVADPTPSAGSDDVVSMAPPPVAPTAQQAQHLAGLGPCVTCGGPGAVQAEFPWTVDKPVFCRRDCPPQYRHLLND